jgi:hypothetical protein
MLPHQRTAVEEGHTDREVPALCLALRRGSRPLPARQPAYRALADAVWSEVHRASLNLERFIAFDE